SSTNLELYRAVTRSYSADKISYWVVEFENVKSLQMGLTTVANNSVSVAVSIASVDLAKALLFFSSAIAYACPDPLTKAVLCGYFSNNTTITFERGGYDSSYDDTCYISWYVLELP
ncbi:hypothetical protein, partial [Marinobacter sp.]|uniref:hypothetical protein n=1 Tax=Marinobacter sp. TaxID=50741 RepID=UPI0025C248A7